MTQEPRIIPVILAGGEGKRLWPLSTPHKPKQFLASAGQRSLFQDACLRACRLSDSMIVMTAEPYRFIVLEQLQALGILQATIVLEPVPRNTAPSIASAAIAVQQQHPHALMLVMPSDHYIGEEDAWRRAVQRAAARASEGHHVTFGVQPNHPSTHYGYIGKGAPHAQDAAAFFVQAFHEKPDEETAQHYVRSGHFWNSGMFVFDPSALLQEMEQLEPALTKDVRHAQEKAKADGAFWRLDVAAYERCPSVAIDRVLMERTQQAMVVEGGFSWSDLGSYQSLEHHYDHMDAAPLSGFADEMSNFIYSPERPVYMLGVDHIRVVATDDVTVVMPRDMEEVSESVIREFQTRRSRMRGGVEYRPWGYFQPVFEEANVKVKRLTIRPFARISLQEHQRRSEHWVVIKGQARITIGDVTRVVKADESVYVPKGCKHRIENMGDQELVIIEIQSGEELSEDDIIRYEDDYGRHQ